MILMLGCSRPAGNQHAAEDGNAGGYAWTAGGRDILYYMALPAQMAGIFEDSLLEFRPALPNAPGRSDQYTTQVGMAANMGIYGADLGYVSIMERDQEAAETMLAIYSLSGRLGIPRALYAGLLSDLGNIIRDPDEMSVQIDSVFRVLNVYLKQSGREGLTAAMMLGGWIETLYIASRIYSAQPGHQELLERIVEQKYALNYLIHLLNNNQDDPELLQYNLMLKTLKRSYDQVSIMYEKGNVSVDTVSKTIIAKQYRIETSERAVGEIIEKLASIRSRLIN